jgi:alkylation response protein AidB-like acyl-CoA dehydrogenase
MAGIDAETTIAASDSIDEVRAKVKAWLDATLPSWWPDGPRQEIEDEWKIAYHRAGLATPDWPVEHGGLGLSREAARAINIEVVARQAPVPLNLVTVQMIGAVLRRWGTDEQRARLLRPLARRDEVWCQLFSEPGAGSDLASLATRAERDGDNWVVTGQKVWCSFAAEAARGLLLARTDIASPKQGGISSFALDMHSSGVTVRPLRQMTGDATFCEVFLDAVVVPDDDRIGAPNGGWRVAGTMLSAERNMLGGAGASAVARVGGVDMGTVVSWIADATPGLRDAVLQALVDERVTGLLASRLEHNPSYSPLVKLRQGLHNQRLQSLATLAIGPRSIAHHDDPEAAEVAWGFLRSRANTIGGGTSEVMRTLIGERLLGLPREPDPFYGKPWSEVPRS